jgi:hypothetical protein
MRAIHTGPLLLMLVLGSAFRFEYLQETREVESSKKHEPVEILDRIEEVMNLGGHYWQYYREYFASASVDDVAKNSFSPSPSFAAQCAWRTRGASSATRKNEGEPPDMSLVWFIGFVEGRATIDIPGWWEEFLIANGARGGLPWGLKGIQNPPKTSFEGVPESIRKRFQADLDSKWNSFAISRGEGRIVIARYTELGLDGNLWCFDIDSEKLLWTRRGPECKFAGATGGAIDFRVTMDIAGDEVLLAGAGSLYTLHVFNLETGATQFFFCSLH